MRAILPAFAFIAFLFSCSPASKISKTAVPAVAAHEVLKHAHVGISIYDMQERKTVYAFQQDKYFVPASNTKIPTCYAAMKYLGDSLVNFRYHASADTIYILPSGDPLFLHPDFVLQPGLEFLKQFRLVRIYNRGFSNFLGSGWSWNDYQSAYMAQRSDLPLYGNIVRFRINEQNDLLVYPDYFISTSQVPLDLAGGFRIQKPWAENDFYVVPGNSKTSNIPFNPTLETMAALLEDTLNLPVELVPMTDRSGIEFHSFHTDSMLKPMMHRSDNFFAEQSLVMAASELLGKMNISEITDTILKTDFKDLPQKPRWVDGSGLSRYNLFTPSSFVAILEKMHDEFGMERIKILFPTGDEGTLSGYYLSLKDRLFAKTGTLSGVVALSGFIRAKSNRLLAFSVLVNNHQSDARQVRREVESFLTDIAEQY